MMKFFMRDHMKNRTILIIILAFALLLRIFYAISEYRGNVEATLSDDILYNRIAVSIQEKGLMKYQDGEGLAYLIISPGIPVLLSLEKRILGEGWPGIFIFNAFLSVAVLLFIYLVAKKILNEKTALFSVAWGAIYIMYIHYTPTAGKELWISLFFIVNCWMLIRLLMNEKYTVKAILLFALLFAALIHVDERYMAYLPLFAVSLFTLHRAEMRFIRTFSLATLFTVAVIILLVPWVYRNYVVHREIMILTPRTQHITGLIFKTEPEYPDVIKEIRTTRYEISQEKIDSVLAGFEVTDNAGREMTPQQYDAIRKHGRLPRRFSRFENALMSFRTLWKPMDLTYNYTTGGYRFDGKWSLKHNLSVGLTFGLLLPFMAVGWIYLFRRNRPMAYLLLAILVWHTLVHVIFIPFTRNRYRIPVDFIVIILGCQGILYTLTPLFKKAKGIIRYEKQN